MEAKEIKLTEERELEKALAWRDSLLKVQIPKEVLADIVLIIYIINWDVIIKFFEKRYNVHRRRG